MQEAYELTRKDGATASDGVTAKDYEANLEANLMDLLDRIKSGRSRPPGAQKLHPQGDGRNDRSAFRPSRTRWRQRAIAMVLEAVYEQDFRPCSCGFRPSIGA